MLRPRLEHATNQDLFPYHCLWQQMSLLFPCLCKLSLAVMVAESKQRLLMCSRLSLQPTFLARDQTGNSADSEKTHLTSESLKGKRLNSKHKSKSSSQHWSCSFQFLNADPPGHPFRMAWLVPALLEAVILLITIRM